MSPNQCSLEEHFTWFLNNPMDLLGGRRSLPEPAKPSAVQRSASTSPASFLDRLPLELLHIICMSLDFQSLSRLSRTSLRNKIIVESHPPYRDLMKYAPRTLSALGETRLIRVHFSAKLHATLHSANCVSCGEFGTFLFLPTCERVCYECLRRNSSFWMIPDTLAKKCFKIKKRQLDAIPCTYHIYQSLWLPALPRAPQLLYDVKSVKKLAIMIHGTNRKVTGLVPAQPPQNTTRGKLKAYHQFKWLLNAPLEPFESDPLTVPKEPDTPYNDFPGVASILFPSLSSENSLESGLWCRGCDYLDRKYLDLSSRIPFHLVPPGVESHDYFNGMKYRARSRADFLSHIRNCYGVKMIISESGDNSRYH